VIILWTGAARLCARRCYCLLRLPREAHSGVIPRSACPGLNALHPDAPVGARKAVTGPRKYITHPSELEIVKNRQVWCLHEGIRKIMRPKINESAGCVEPPVKHHCAGSGRSRAVAHNHCFVVHARATLCTDSFQFRTFWICFSSTAHLLNTRRHSAYAGSSPPLYGACPKNETCSFSGGLTHHCMGASGVGNRKILDWPPWKEAVPTRSWLTTR